MKKLLFALTLLLASCQANAAETACPDWANFTKVVTYRVRDNGIPLAQAKAQMTSDAANFKELDSAELPKALAWMDYSYEHPEVTDPNKMWEMAYEECKAQKIIKSEK